MITLYAANKTRILVKRDDTTISEFTKKAGLSTEVFTFQDTNAFIAFGFTSKDTPILDIERYLNFQAILLDQNLEEQN